MRLQIAALPAERLLRWLPGLTMALFVFLIGLVLTRLFWLLFPAPDGGGWQPRPAQAAQVERQQARLDVNGLIATKLFGEVSADAPPPTLSDVQDAPDTNLRLTLRGIFAADDNEAESRALIEPANGELEYYAVGDPVPGGAKLHSILADRVLLERAGRLETLRLERDAPTSAAAQNARELISRTNLARPGIPNPDEVIDAATAAEMSQIRTEILNDPTKASDYLRIQPAQRNGQLRGYRIYPGRKRELFRSAGLRPGDLVTQVNGVQLDDPSKGLGLLGDLSQSSQITLTVERGGQSRNISVTLN